MGEESVSSLAERMGMFSPLFFLTLSWDWGLGDWGLEFRGRDGLMCAALCREVYMDEYVGARGEGLGLSGIIE
jgi:hypothetical protein